MAQNETYEQFVEKFKPKLTTDDCYTPPLIYDAILEWAKNEFDLQGKNILRPFYPGGDYEAIEYTENDVVIDNPPFSILTKICRYYEQHNVKYILFAPSLTIFNSVPTCSYLITDADVIYENGANVKTSFITNLYSEPQIKLLPQLRRKLISCNPQKKKLKKFAYPDELITPAYLGKLVRHNKEWTIPLKHSIMVSKLDNGKGTGVYGRGRLLNERLTAEKKAIENDLPPTDIRGALVIELSEREKNLLKNL